jgi:hypothetical protein
VTEQKEVSLREGATGSGLQFCSRTKLKRLGRVFYRNELGVSLQWPLAFLTLLTFLDVTKVF